MVNEEQNPTTITISDNIRKKLAELANGKQSYDEVLTGLFETKELLKEVMPKMVESSRRYFASYGIVECLLSLTGQNPIGVFTKVGQYVGATGDRRLRELYDLLIGSRDQSLNSNVFSQFCNRVQELMNENSGRLTQAITDLERKTENDTHADDKSVFLEDEVEPQLYSIVEEATKYITLVTPYVELWGHLQSKIERALARGVIVNFVVRKDWVDNIENNPRKEERKMRDLDWLLRHNVKVYEKERLHAKIYMNEVVVLVSSMNVYNYSANNSLEFALMVRNRTDALRLRNYVSELVKTAQPISPPTELKEPLSAQVESQVQRKIGSCIRCGRQISLNPQKPLCPNCYSIWSEYGDPDYEEKYCHLCGKHALVTLRKPLCQRCYQH